MPEGPELHLASLFVNRVCEGLVFTGAVEKSDVSKNPEVPFCCETYRIKAHSRGKEVKLTLCPIKSDASKDGSQEPMDVVFRFGMSGFFHFTSEEDLPKHAHLRFYTNEKPRRVLSFVDPRRFGGWQPDGTWQLDRGPCVIFEYESFRENVLSNLSDKAFDKPICEALLNQKYFNGIGNYLRAEILYRAHIAPFVKARTVLENLQPEEKCEKKFKEEATVVETSDLAPDLLSLCHAIPLEVVKLGKNGYGPERKDYSVLMAWMQCYYVEGMNTIKDHNGRTMWFKGDAGPMAPKASKTQRTKRTVRKVNHDGTKSKKAKKHTDIETTDEKIGTTKVKKEKGLQGNPEGLRTTKRRVKAEPATEAIEMRRTRSSKGSPRTGLKGQAVEEVVKAKRRAGKATLKVTPQRRTSSRKSSSR